VKMISADVAGQGRAEMDILDRAEKRELLVLERIARATLVPAIVE